MKRNTILLPRPATPTFKVVIPPVSLDLGIGSDSKNRRKNHSWFDRHSVWSTILIFGIMGMIAWWVDCKLNPEAHSQSLLQGLHQLFH
jgi:hypothetical protein